MAANIRPQRTRFLFLQNPNDLLIAEPAAFHSSVPLSNRLYRKLATFQGSTSCLIADRGLSRRVLCLFALNEGHGYWMAFHKNTASQSLPAGRTFATT